MLRAVLAKSHRWVSRMGSGPQLVPGTSSEDVRTLGLKALLVFVSLCQDYRQQVLRIGLIRDPGTRITLLMEERSFDLYLFTSRRRRQGCRRRRQG